MSRSTPLNFVILKVSVSSLRKCALALSCSTVICSFVLLLRFDHGILQLHSFTTASIKVDDPFTLLPGSLSFYISLTALQICFELQTEMLHWSPGATTTPPCGNESQPLPWSAERPVFVTVGLGAW